MKCDFFQNMGWMKILMILCIFGFLKEFRPNEPFVTNYLTGKWKNFTKEQVNEEIYPFGTYCYFAMLIIVFLITDLARYKPIIVLCGLSGSVTFTIIRFGTTIFELQLVEFFYGIFLSTEVAYYTYIYAKVDKKHYQEVTSYTKTAILLGRFVSGVVSQLTTSFGLLDYEQLIYLTLAGLASCTFWALLLPPAKKSIYFHRPLESTGLGRSSTNSTLPVDCDQTTTALEENIVYSQNKNSISFALKLKRAYALLWQDLLKAYSNLHVVKWSLWWAFSTCGYLQALNYVQLLWGDNNNGDVYNGAIEALLTVIGAATAFAVGKLPLNWILVGEITLSLFSFLDGLLLVAQAQSHNIWVLYSTYIAFGVIYHTVITVANFEVAKYISEDSYGLIFGLNTFYSLLLQSLLTYIVINSDFFDFDIREQFSVYGYCFIILGVIFVIMAFFTIIQKYRSGERMTVWLKHDEEVSENSDGNGNEKSITQNAAVC